MLSYRRQEQRHHDRPPLAAGRAHTFTYDAAGRKTSEVDGKGTTTWACYDANDRSRQVSTASSNCDIKSRLTAVTGLTPSGGTLVKREYTYPTGTNTGLVQTNKDQNDTTITYTYDGQGNQTSGGDSYNGFDQLTGTTSGGTASLTYAGVSNNERTQAGGTAFTTNLASGQVGQRTTSSSGEKYIREPNGTLVAWHNDPGASFYYTLDNLNSVLLVTNSSGTSAAAYTYDPYGNTLSATGSEATNNPWRYTSAYLDPTGLYKMGARYYNPNTGRFTQPDPSGQEANRYNYAGNNPITYSDPSGLSFSDVIGTVGDIIGVAGSLVPGGPGIALSAVSATLGFVSELTSENGSFGSALGGAAVDFALGVTGAGLGRAVTSLSGSAQAAWGAEAAYGVGTGLAQAGYEYCSENTC